MERRTYVFIVPPYLFEIDKFVIRSLVHIAQPQPVRALRRADDTNLVNRSLEKMRTPITLCAKMAGLK
jgi:hypothetical protein